MKTKRLSKKLREKILEDCWALVAPYGLPRNQYDKGTVELDEDGITCSVVFRHKTARHFYITLDRSYRIEFNNVYFNDNGIMEACMELR